MHTPLFRRVATTLAALALLAAGAAAAATRAHAQTPLVQGEHLSVQLGGYVRSLGAYYDRGYDVPTEDRSSTFNSDVLRLKWTASIGDRSVLQLHDRIQSQVSLAGAAPGALAAGLGVSVVPGRSLDLSSRLIDRGRLSLWHDVDRLSLSLYTNAADITLGRQAITWGNASFFPVADLWARFSPFELDTEEKPGIDALRVLLYPADGVEVDAVLADRGSLDDLSAGVRATFTLPSADVYGAVGKFWNEAMVLGGASVVRDQLKLRAEAALPWDLDRGALGLPRITLGFDRLGGKLLLSGEYHFNGIGAAATDDYLQRLGDPRIGRGESYFLGRHYLGGLASLSASDRLTLSLNALLNATDGSTVLTGLGSYDLGQSIQLSAGAMKSFGATPVLAPAPRLRSEFGSYGDLWFVRASLYF